MSAIIFKTADVIAVCSEASSFHRPLSANDIGLRGQRVRPFKSHIVIPTEHEKSLPKLITQTKRYYLDLSRIAKILDKFCSNQYIKAVRYSETWKLLKKHLEDTKCTLPNYK